MTIPIRLYSFAPSQNAVRTELALLEKGLEFEKVEVNLLEGEHRQPWYAEVTPRQQVPTLVYGQGDEAITVYESIATIRFIDDLHTEPPLMPPVNEPRRRARALMRIEEFQAKLDPKNIFGSVAFGKKSKEELAPRIDALVEELARWERYVAGQEYLAGSQFTLADIAVFPLLIHFEVLGYDYPSRSPQLAAYIDKCKSRPSVKKTGWVDTFTAFAKARGTASVLG